MELSIRDWERMILNSIHLTGYTVTIANKNRILFYVNITYGKLIQPTNKGSMSNGKPLWYKEINLIRMKGKN